MISQRWRHVKEKAAQLLAERRIKILSRSPVKVTAEVKGEHDVYHVIVYRDGRWSCTCQHGVFSSKKECSHVIAVKAIADFPISCNIYALSELERELLSKIVEKGKLTKRDVMKLFNLEDGRASYILRKLRDRGLIKLLKFGRIFIYLPTNIGERLVKKG